MILDENVSISNIRPRSVKKNCIEMVMAGQITKQEKKPFSQRFDGIEWNTTFM